MSEELMTKHEVARLVGVKPSTIDQWRREGRLQCRRLSARVIRYAREDVLDLIRRGKDAPCTPK